MTEAQFLELEQRAECRSQFVNGEVFAMSGGSPNHSLIKVNLYGGLRNRLRGASWQVFGSDLMVKVGATGLLTYPDVSITRDRLSGGEYILLTPAVLIEVLSPTTEAWDRGCKWDHYQHIPTLTEYILVSEHQPKVERFVRQADGPWLLDTYRGLNAELPIDAVGVRIPLSEIYLDVTFEESAIS